MAVLRSFCFRPFVNNKSFGGRKSESFRVCSSGACVPLYGAENGVLERNGHTEATLDMTRMAGLKPGGALVEILNEDGTMARLPQLGEIAAKFGLKIVSIKDIQEYRKNITSKSNKYGTQSKKSKDIASDS